MKYFLFFLLFIFHLNDSTAQKREIYIDDATWTNSPEPRFGIGLIGGINRSDMDFGLHGRSWQSGIQANIVMLRFLYLNTDYQAGQLQGEPLSIRDMGQRKYVSFNTSYNQISVTARFLPLRLFMWDMMNPIAETFTYFYAGLGYGYMSFDTDATPLQDEVYGYMAKQGKTNVFIQELGVDFPIINIGKNKLFLGFNYRFCKSNTDLIDGYKPLHNSNQHNDVYSTYNAAITFKF